MSVGSRVEMPVDSEGSGALQVRLLGALTIARDGAELALPSSRKVRGLFAYLALAPRAVPRSQLCELLWDVPNDPRGELRWCLSKIRGVIGAARVETKDDTVALILADCFIDARDVAEAMQRGIETLPPERLRALLALFAGDFLEGLEIDRSPVFNGWLTAQRRRFRGCHAALLEHLAARVPDDEAFGYLEKWLQLAPFDQRVHEKLLTTLARRGLIREGEEHLAATAQIFEAEALDVTPLRNAWRAARAAGRVRPGPRPGRRHGRARLLETLVAQLHRRRARRDRHDPPAPVRRPRHGPGPRRPWLRRRADPLPAPAPGPAGRGPPAGGDPAAAGLNRRAGRAFADRGPPQEAGSVGTANA